MQEIVKINLDNEMDLILAHKRSMKIAELCGLPSSAQTRFSTAVSEIARCSIANGKQSVLVLGINVIRPTQKEILAVITDAVDIKKISPEAFAYAGRISGNIEYGSESGKFITKLSQPVSSPGLLSETKIKGFKEYFQYEPPLSPYDEIRKKNIELIALSEKLGESENRYRQLTDTLPVLICIADDRDRILLSNARLKDYLEVPLAAFDRNTILKFIAPEDAESVLAGWDKAKKSGSGFYGQARIKKDNGKVWHLVSIIPNKSENGTFNSWLIFFVDIDAQKIVEETLNDNSELKMIQQQLEKSNSQLSFKNKELQQFAFIASHDLQEPLRKIKIMLSRASGYLSDEQRQDIYLDRISASAERMSELIADVLDYSRIEDSSKLFTAVDLNEIVPEIANDLSVIIEEKSALIEVGVLPEITGIATQLRQLLYNLINNALKFNEGKPVITITATLLHAADCPPELRLVGDQHLITVSDNGIGMDIAYSDKVFNMFQRLHHRDTYAGNGIGLALCRRVVENHNGVITFTSQLNEGTTFYIYLPVT